MWPRHVLDVANTLRVEGQGAGGGASRELKIVDLYPIAASGFKGYVTDIGASRPVELFVAGTRSASSETASTKRQRLDIDAGRIEDPHGPVEVSGSPDHSERRNRNREVDPERLRASQITRRQVLAGAAVNATFGVRRVSQRPGGGRKRDANNRLRSEVLGRLGVEVDQRAAGKCRITRRSDQRGARCQRRKHGTDCGRDQRPFEHGLAPTDSATKNRDRLAEGEHSVLQLAVARPSPDAGTAARSAAAERLEWAQKLLCAQ